MLQSIKISNFLLIDKLELDFNAGLTVVTGETGSGKSIIIDALMLIFGARATSDIIRHNQVQAVFMAEFSLSNQQAKIWLVDNDLIDPDNLESVICRRIIDRNGKNKLYINGHVVTLNQVRTLGDFILDIHTQFASITLLKSEMQRNLLDEYANITTDVQYLAIVYKQMCDLEQKLNLAQLQKTESEIQQQLLHEQLNELNALNLKPNEWHELEQEQLELTNASVLLNELDYVQEVLAQQDSSLLSNISKMQLHLAKIATYTAKATELISLADSVEAELNELAHGLTSIKRNIEEDPGRLQSLEERMSQIFDLSRKYRITPETIPQVIDEITQQLILLDRDTNTEILEQELQSIRQKYFEIAKTITTARTSFAIELSKQVTYLLHKLAINGEFKVQLKPVSDETIYGLEDIEYQICFNQGMQLQPLAKVASGGELSRTALALYLLLSINNSPEVIIFDEIDVGIGGKVAAIVGQMLSELGRAKQVICITHQAQTASYANEHIVVSKNDNAGITTAQVEYINAEKRIAEIARMLSGISITNATLLHAREMLASALGSKNTF